MLTLIGYLVVQALRPVAPATIRAVPLEDQIHSSGGRFYVPIEVRNAGGATARDVLIETRLEGGGPGNAAAEAGGAASGVDLVSETVIDFLAGGESQRIFAVFEIDPRGRRVVPRVLSYQEP